MPIVLYEYGDSLAHLKREFILNDAAQFDQILTIKVSMEKLFNNVHTRDYGCTLVDGTLTFKAKGATTNS